MNRKRSFWKVCCLCLCFFLFGLEMPLDTALAQTVTKDIVESVEGLKVEIQWGDSTLFRMGRDVPIVVRLISTGAEMSGTARVEVPMGNGQYYVLEEVLAVNAGQTSQATLCVPITGDMGIARVEYRGDDGTLYGTKTVTLRASYSNQQIYVAAISSDISQMAHYDRVVLNEYGGTGTRLFDFKIDTLPVDADILKIYDIFLWDDVSLESVSEEQMEALTSWVYEGGVLISGFGSDWKDDLEPMEIRRERWGRGQYIYCGFSLRSIPDIYEGENGIRDFLYEAVGEARMTVLEENIGDAFGEYRSASDVTSGVDVNRLPKVGQYGVVLAVYLLLLGPVSYHILKKKKRRSLLRRVMIGLALVFTVVIYIMGGGTRFRRPFVNYASIREIRQGIQMETIYANVSSPGNKAYTLSFAEGYEISPLVSYDYSDPNSLKDDGYRLRIRQDGQGTQVHIREGIPFTQQLLSLTGLFDSPYEKGFTGEFLLFERGFEGILHNASGEDFEGVSIWSGGRVVFIGDMAAGEQVDLSQMETKLVYGQDQNRLLMEIVGMAGQENSRAAKQVSSQAYWRYSLLNDYFNNRLLDEGEEALILAFPAKEDTSYMSSHDVDVQGTTLVTEALPLDYSKNGQYYQTMAESRIEVMQGSYSFARNSVSEGLCVLRYDFEDLEISRLVLQWPQLSGASEYMMVYDQALEFYNWETKTYDAMGRKERYTNTELEPYLDEDNCLTVRYMVEVSGQSYYEVFLPDFSAVGRRAK